MLRNTIIACTVAGALMAGAGSASAAPHSGAGMHTSGSRGFASAASSFRGGASSFRGSATAPSFRGSIGGSRLMGGNRFVGANRFAGSNFAARGDFASRHFRDRFHRRGFFPGYSDNDCYYDGYRYWGNGCSYVYDDGD